MVRCGVDVLFLDFSMVHYITVLLHFLIYQASVLSAVYATLVCLQPVFSLRVT